MMWPFKWKHSACTFTWCYFFVKILENEIWKFARNLPLATFGSERVKLSCQWPKLEIFLNSHKKNVVYWNRLIALSIILSIRESKLVRIKLIKWPYIGLETKQEGRNTQLSKVSRFLFKSFHIRRLQKQLFILPYKSLYFERYPTVLMVIFRAWATCVKTRTHAI